MLVAELWPAWVGMVRSHRASEDHVYEVLARLVERIGANDGRGLGLFVMWHRRHLDKSFADWLRIVMANVVRDYVRQQAGPGLDPQAAQDLAVRKLIKELATSPCIDELGKRPAMTDAQTARELAEYAERCLPPLQARALSRWVEGAGGDEIARDIGLPDAEAAQKLVRAAVASLRRHFGVA